MNDGDRPQDFVREVATSAARGVGRVFGVFAASAGICVAAGGGVAWWYMGGSFVLAGAGVGAAIGVAICVFIFYLLNE